MNRQISFFASFGGSRADMRTSLQKLATRQVAPVIHRVVELSEMGNVLAQMARREVFGKLLLRGFARTVG